MRPSKAFRVTPAFWRQFLYFCTSKASKLSTLRVTPAFSQTRCGCSSEGSSCSRQQLLQRQCLYFCTSNSRDAAARAKGRAAAAASSASLLVLLYFCTFVLGKASEIENLRTPHEHGGRAICRDFREGEEVGAALAIHSHVALSA